MSAILEKMKQVLMPEIDETLLDEYVSQSKREMIHERQLEKQANPILRSLDDDSAYTKIVGGLIALLVTIGVGALVFWEITDNFEGSSSDANDSIDEVEDMASTVFDLLPIIALVVVAAIIIGIVVKMGGGN